MQTEKDGAIAPRVEGVTTRECTRSREGLEPLKDEGGVYRDVADHAIMHSTSPCITKTSIVPNLHRRLYALVECERRGHGTDNNVVVVANVQDAEFCTEGYIRAGGGEKNVI
jgi:hypothetical protein